MAVPAAGNRRSRMQGNPEAGEDIGIPVEL